MQVSFLQSVSAPPISQGQLASASLGVAGSRVGGLTEAAGLPPGALQQALVGQQLMELTSQLMGLLLNLMRSGDARRPSVGLSGLPLPSDPSLFPSAQAPSSGARIPGGASLFSTGKGKGMFHKGAPGAPDTYAFENSPAGIRFAAERGYDSIDIDMQITKDGVPVATHWSKPMKKDGFFDPLGKLKPSTKVGEMTLAEVMRLRNKDGQSQIYPVATMVQQLKKHGIAGSFEAKDDPRFASDQVMGYLANLVRGSGIRANLLSLDRGPRSLEILEAGQRHGFFARFGTGKGKAGRSLGYA